MSRVTLKSSTIFISVGNKTEVYRSVNDVPPPLRKQLEQSTSGIHSATILIADRRGRQEITKAMRNLPGPAQRRLMHSLLGGETGRSAWDWLTPARKKGVLALVFLLALTLVAIVFLHRWQ